MNRKEFLAIATEAFRKWQTSSATVRAAAIAFFTVLPLPSLLVILTALFAVVYGAPQALQHLTDQVSSVAGPTVAQLVRELLKSAQNPFTSIFGSVLSIAFAAAGAIGAFSVLQDSLNSIWAVVQPEKQSLTAKLKKRIVPFFIVSITGSVILAWTSVTVLLSSSLSFILEPLIGNAAAIVTGALQIVFSFVLTTFLFAFIYTQIPDTTVELNDVWVAALLTSLVSTILNYFFGVYVQTFPVTTVAGAAGSLMLLLLWIFIIDMFILFGAQFSFAYAKTLGSRSADSRIKKLRN